MYDYIFGTFDSFKGFFDKMLSCLNKHLYCHIIGNVVALNQLTAYFVISFRGGRKTDFNFFKAHFAKSMEELEFFFKVHRVDKCLVAVPQVNTAPCRCLGDYIVRPLTVGKINLLKWNILLIAPFHFIKLLIYFFSQKTAPYAEQSSVRDE